MTSCAPTLLPLPIRPEVGILGIRRFQVCWSNDRFNDGEPLHRPAVHGMAWHGWLAGGRMRACDPIACDPAPWAHASV